MKIEYPLNKVKNLLDLINCYYVCDISQNIRICLFINFELVPTANDISLLNYTPVILFYVISMWSIMYYLVPLHSWAWRHSRVCIHFFFHAFMLLHSCNDFHSICQLKQFIIKTFRLLKKNTNLIQHYLHLGPIKSFLDLRGRELISFPIPVYERNHFSFFLFIFFINFFLSKYITEVLFHNSRNTDQK